jgi:hypothetical protein
VASGATDEAVYRHNVDVDVGDEVEAVQGALRGLGPVVLFVIDDIISPELENLLLAVGLSHDLLLLVGGPIKRVSETLAGCGRGDAYMVSVW